MKWPRKETVPMTYHDAVRWRRRNGWLTIASLVALYLVISVLSTEQGLDRRFSIWDSVARVLAGVVLAGWATWHAMAYRTWDRRITAMGVVHAQAAAMELMRTGVYTEDEA